MSAIELVEKSQLAERPAMKAGDTVRVHVKVREGDKERIQVFEGVVIGLHRGGTRASFTVRKVSFGQGVERIFPLHSPTIRSAAGCSTFRSSRGPRRSATCGCPRCCCRATTRKSGAGGSGRRWNGRSNGGRIY